jgi:hypothetical protein
VASSIATSGEGHGQRHGNHAHDQARDDIAQQMRASEQTGAVRLEQRNHGDIRCGFTRSGFSRVMGVACSAATARGGACPCRAFRLPGLACARFDVAADQPAQHLRGRGIFLGTQALEHRLLARIDEYGKAGGAAFHMR